MTLPKQILNSQPIVPIADRRFPICDFLPQLEYGDRWSLIVTLNTGQFTLVEIHNGAIAVRVTAPEAQTIKDYLNANWPVGTIADWIVVPPFQPVTPARNRLWFIPSV
jgi:hypothetical protein